jgi:hypothetical protein
VSAFSLVTRYKNNWYNLAEGGLLILRAIGLEVFSEESYSVCEVVGIESNQV